MADSYVILLDAILENPSKAAHGREGYSFVESDEHETLELTNTIGQVLQKLGAITKAKPSILTEA